MKKHILFGLFCLYSTLAFSQINDELPVNDSLYNALEETNNLDSFGGAAGNKEVQQVVSLKGLCSPLSITKFSNGGLGWAIAVTQTMSMQYKDLHKQTKSFSYQFIYDALPKVRKSQCALSETWILDTKTFLENTGTLTLPEYPFTTPDCNRKPDPKLLEKPQMYRVRSFNRLFEVMPKDGSISVGGKISRIKKSLARNHPVILCIVADEHFKNLTSAIWNPTASSEGSLQTVVVVGFDETKQLIEVMGNHSLWGNAGFSHIRFEDMRYAKFGFELVMSAQAPTPIAENSPKPALSKPSKPANPQKPVNPSQKIIKPGQTTTKEVMLSGELVVNEVIEYKQFRKVDIRRTPDGYYEMPRVYKVKDQFQLISQKSQVGSFVYVFSVDPKGKAEIHYPDNIGFSLGMSTVNISSVVPDTNSQVVIPGPRIEQDNYGNEKRIERALSKDYKGTDWLVVLHSDRRLDNELETLVNQLNHHVQDFMPAFQKVFGGRLIEKNHISYDGSKFKANTQKGYIVPMILKLEAN